MIKMIEPENLSFSMHTWSSALSTAASVSPPGFFTHGDCMDFRPHWSPMQHEMVCDPWEQVQGYLEVRDKAGLGVEVVEETVRKYAIQ